MGERLGSQSRKDSGYSWRCSLGFSFNVRLGISRLGISRLEIANYSRSACDSTRFVLGGSIYWVCGYVDYYDLCWGELFGKDEEAADVL